MRKTVKIVIKILLLLFVVSLITAAIVCYNAVKNDELAKKIIADKPLKFAVLLYGNENSFTDKLDILFVSYENDNKLLKVLSVNGDIVVFRKKAKAKSLKSSFYETAKKDHNLAVTNTCTDLFEMLDNSFMPDFYINASYDTFLKIMGNDKFVEDLLKNENFVNRDLECLNALETCELSLSFADKNPLKIIKRIKENYSLLDTNISKTALSCIVLRKKIPRAAIMFCDYPAKYKKTRVEPDKMNAFDFLYTVYYPQADMEYKEDSGLVELKNASKKPRMAEKGTWLLRQNKFDVLDWSNFPIRYETTIIKDYKGSFAKSLKIAETLKCGKVIVSYDNQTYYNMSVFIGTDCEIYDKLDKKEVKNGKN